MLPYCAEKEQQYFWYDYPVLDLLFILLFIQKTPHNYFPGKIWKDN